MKLIYKPQMKTIVVVLESYLYTKGLTAVPVIALLNTSGLATDQVLLHEVITVFPIS